MCDVFLALCSAWIRGYLHSTADISVVFGFLSAPYRLHGTCNLITVQENQDDVIVNCHELFLFIDINPLKLKTV